ncbi:putative DNA endonuclease SmrA [Methyloligella halotolerans]|uniref:Putative DNA endonuclease SmrA n=1 Tax=Methyloligella halotolerans TaxID=1177755 RepID=A0A1E2S0W5_9HYPH|nr:Smr/MutS family protein [Methyloligella halotolerans]ODA68040.1 putative DNA endonuclease SmrA [Methyloligella halotolerans]
MGKKPKGGPDLPDTEDDDASLWDKIAGTVVPLKKRDVRAAPLPKPPTKIRASKTLKDPEDSPAAPKPSLMKPPAKPGPPAPASIALDRGTARKLEKGRLPVEAKLDLHGMRQRHAHSALRRFLMESQAKGFRHVLVITGKGTAKSTSENFYMEEPRGVLRQQVPGWLTQPDLASVVVSFSEAPQRLGGAGALYVRLRRVR